MGYKQKFIEFEIEKNTFDISGEKKMISVRGWEALAADVMSDEFRRSSMVSQALLLAEFRAFHSNRPLVTSSVNHRQL